MKRIFAGTVVLIILFILPVHAQENFNIQEIGLYHYEWHGLREFIPTGDIAIGITNLAGISVFDISDYDNVHQTSFFELPEFGIDLIVRDDVGYVLLPSAGLYILDVSNPNQISEIGSYNDNENRPENRNRFLSLVGDIAILSGSDGFSLIDISDPRNPTNLSFIENEGTSPLVINGEYFYYDSHGFPWGFQIIDFSNPRRPVRVDSFVDIELGSSLIVDNHLIDVSTISLSVYNLEDPRIPELVSEFILRGSILMGLYALDDIAYTSQFRLGILLLDISDLEQIEVLSHIETPIGSMSFQRQDDELFLPGGWGGLAIADVSEPDAPEIICYYGQPSQVKCIEVNGDQVYIIDRRTEFMFYDISNPDQILLSSRSRLFGSDWQDIGMVRSGENLFTTHGTIENRREWRGLRVTSIANPEDPDSTAELQTESALGDIIIREDIAYADQQSPEGSGICTFDISDPENPVTIGNVIEPGFTIIAIHMDGDLIYAFSDSLAFTYVFNVSNPTEPVLVSRFSPNEITEDFEIQYDILGVGQDIIYFSATVYDDSVVVNDDIHIFDSADLDNIQFVSCYNPEDIVVGKPFIIKESVALVNVIRANSETGIGVLDLTDPADPILVGFSESLFSIEKTKFVDETAIVAGNGIGIYNCSEAINFNFPPAFTDAPTESLIVPEVGVEVSLDITGRDRKGEAVSFSVIWDGNDPGVSFSDKEDGTAEFRWTPEEEDEGLHTAHFIISDGALTDTATTVLVVGNVQSVEPDPTHPSSMSLLEVYPNPFNSMTTIRYTTPNTSEVKLTIYDVVGRQIADLFFGTVESGGHSFVFDGSGFESGVYVVRLTNGGEDKHEKILLVK